MRKKIFLVLLSLFMIFTGCQAPFMDAGDQILSSDSRSIIEQWKSDVIYLKDDRVLWNDVVYVAGWWTRGEEPGTTGQWGVWKVDQTQEVLSLNFSSSALTVAPGTIVDLNWNSDNAVSIEASGAWSGSKPLIGAESVTINSSSTYSLTATSSSGESVTKSVKIQVEAVIPSISFSASQTTIEKGKTTILTWNSSNVSELTASGDWTGSKPLRGSEATLPLNSDAQFILTGVDTNGVTVSKTINITVTTIVQGDYPKTVGETVILSDSMIQSRFNGIDTEYLPTAVAGSIQELMTRADYEVLFPRRYGTAKWSETSGKVDEDYFSYDNLITALQDMAQFKLRLELKGWSSRVYRLEKSSKKATLLREDSDFNTINREASIHIVDFGKFASEGSLEVRKRDLAAFLANIAHETTGGWDTAPDGRFAWGLYFKQEVGHDNNSVGGYTDRSNPVYPYNAAESYHGRGPMQLSWNYNYGYFSQIIYGDKMILINDPDRLADQGKLGFMAGIWFWMTAQGTKPACHDVMVGNWVPTPEDIAANRLPGFGVTVNVINGGLEAGRPNDYRVRDRIGFFEMITSRFGITTGENVDCYTQSPF